MSNRLEVYRLHKMAEAYSSRLSEILRGDWLDFQFDMAVFTYGRHVDGKLAERDDKFKPRWTLEQILNEGHGERMSVADLMLASGVTELTL